MIVGGTGLYIQSVLYDYHFSEAPSDDRFSHKLGKVVEKEGSQYLHESAYENRS